MRVLHVCSEIFPLLKTGGLADVAGALPLALEALGCENRVLVPGFPAIINGILDKNFLMAIPPRFGAHKISLFTGIIPGSGTYVYVIDAPGLYDREGNPYTDKHNNSYPDNYLRFALLGYIAMQLAKGIDKLWKAQVVHGHDWHAGLAAAYLKAAELENGSPIAGSVFTIHNIAYQGVFASHHFNELDLPNQFFHINGLEFYGNISFLKSGLFFSNKLTTVSPTYAVEIQGSEQGFGLNGLLGSRCYDLRGILNGVDSTVWNPAQDKLIANNYSAKSISGKLKSKIWLQEYTGLKVQDEAPLFVVVSRLTDQKGLHLVLDGLSEIIKRGGQLVILGSGEAHIENAFKAAANANPDSVAVKIGYDEEYAHRVIAGGDVICVPSQFEPCGLTQLYGLIYGTLPLVRKVGGLADTVTDCSLENLADETATGFVFETFDTVSFNSSVRRAFALYNRKADWKKVQKRGMQQEFSWKDSAKQYLALYKQVAV